ncbi:MAG: GH3 auxin-responsive promoter family protein [Phycisphaerae bacterium]|nr:GH3 auxin-responsive promoter family protein [Phycisphaerae bacterium]
MLMTAIVKFSTHPAAVSYERATWRPADVQLRKLLSIVKHNCGTLYGQRYGFEAIRTVSDYQQQVPVVTYESIRHDVERMAAGEPNILTAEPPLMFARTSGTTGEPKYIPVTATCRRSERHDFARMWVYHALAVHPEIYNMKVVSLVSPAVEGYTSGGIPYGSVSGSLYKSMPALVRRYYAVPYETFEIGDYQAKYYAVARMSLEQDVGMICTANPSSILKLCEKVDEFSEDLIRDIRDGTLSARMQVEPAIRTALARRLRPNKARAVLLEKARCRRHGVLKPADYWPGIRLIGCWKGGTVGHYLEKFPPWLNPDGDRQISIRDWGYLSSEARCSIPVSDEGSAGILATATNFYEFVPAEQVMAEPKNSAAWTFLTADQIHDGREYHVILTTTGGLYRYNINDVIRVEGCYNQTPQVAFVRKGDGVTNITGEKLSVDQIIEAFGAASDRIGAGLTHFKAEADVDESRYILRAEFQEPVSEDAGRTFLQYIDEHLKHVNIEYKAKRDSMRLAAPVLHVMRRGWYEKSQKELVTGGARAFQSKAELLSPAKSETLDIEPELDRITELLTPHPCR